MTALRELAERWKGGTASHDYEMGRQECADELLSILDAEGDGGAVSIPRDDLQRLVDIGREPHSFSAPRHLQDIGLWAATKLATHTHPVRSGGVSDEQVEAACRAYIAADRFLLDGAVDSMREPMRAALENFAKSQGESNV